VATASLTARRRRRSRRGEGESLRGEILDAAKALLAETGDPGALTLRAAARRLGIAPPSIYLHFRDLESLRKAAIERAFDEFDAARDAAAAGLTDPRAVLLARAQAYCRFALDNPGLYRVMFDVERPASERGLASFQTLVRAIERCQKGGVAEEGDTVGRAALVWAGLHGLASLRINRPQFPWPAPLEHDVERLVVALLGSRP
jgi:AcrR family transcriptional regulator